MGKRKRRLLCLSLTIALILSSLGSHYAVLAAGADAAVTENGEEIILSEPEGAGDEEVSTETEIGEETEETEETEAKTSKRTANARNVSELNGLYAEYWTMTESAAGVFDELKSTGVDYGLDYSDLDPKLLLTTGSGNHAGIKWSGRIKVPVTGNYTFYAYSDNGIRVRLNGSQIINYWDGESWDVLQTSTPVALNAGTYYSFEADFFDHVGGSHLTISWSNDQGMEKTVIPSSALYLPDSYDGPYIESLDAVTKGNLQDGTGFNGTIIVNGQGLDSVEQYEVVGTLGNSLSPEVYADVKSSTGTSTEIEIPNVGVGSYRLKAVAGNMIILSKSLLFIKANTSQSNTRTEHPRADWERSSYVNLNGWWDFDFDPDKIGQKEGWYTPEKEFDSNINVPFCWESSLSGIKNPDYKGQAWYRRTVSVDSSWTGKKIFLKFGAVDWKCKLWVNGDLVGDHIGGYNAFEMDVTEYMRPGESNVITLWVEDYGNYGDDSYPALIGKQGRNAPCGYIHTSGIWQTVGMEARSATYLDNAKAASDIDNAKVTYTLDVTSDKAQELTVEYDFESTLYDVESDKDVKTGSSVKGSQKIQVTAGANTVPLSAIAIQNQKLWNYNEPNLYQGTLTIKDGSGKVLDQLSTYFGLRKIETKYYDEDLGVKYIYINNEPVFMSGLLDQGFWEEGIYTAPSEEALRYDILAMKNAGFNMIRKHLKIEDPLQYYWCDKLGMLVWQDMPHATAMVPERTGGVALGRQYYEECLEAAMNMNYNHPSIVAVMLFNETWGLQGAYSSEQNRNRRASDGKSTAEWVEYLYNKTKELNPNLLVEEMSPCNFDHVQPTDLNTYHFYPSSYAGTVSEIERHVNGAYVGSTVNFKFGEQQDGDPLLNSEYGGVGAYAGDFDVSYCFKYMTDAQRRYEKQSGYVYTEPYDVEYERNGILTYDRKEKIFGYDEIAYGGDMTIKDLNQEIYIGVIDEPIRSVTAGSKVKTKVMAMAWTNDLPENTVVNWRFDGTDIYGNDISTGLSGKLNMYIEPYTKVTASLCFRAPLQACVGTLTVWIESETGEKIAKNFTNIIVTDENSVNRAQTIENEDGSIAMKARLNSRMVTTSGNGSQSYNYTLPTGFGLDDLNSLRVIAEASSYKGEMGTDKNLPSYSSQYGQTAVGRERSSDLTVSINGVEVETVYLPDNPRDMRGTLTLDEPYNGNSSAGDFGYLVNLNVTQDQLTAIKSAIGGGNTITVSYQVKSDAANQNGFRIYSATYGRYAVNPTIILNPEEIASQGELTAAKTISTNTDNYSVEAALKGTAGYTVRSDDGGGYKVVLGNNGSSLSLINAKTNGKMAEITDLVSGDHNVKVTVFDDRIRVYVDQNPDYVMEVYDYSGFTGGVQVNASAANPVSGLVVSPESYPAPKSEAVEEPIYEVNFEDDFSNTDYTSRYTPMGNDWSGTVSNGALTISTHDGDKAIVKDQILADGIYEADITVTNSNGSSGNIGFVFRGKNWNVGADGADGYYAGIGDGYVQLGRMNQNWTELAKVSVPGLTVGSTHTLRVVVFGSRIQIYVDDAEAPCIDLADSMYLSGGVAIRGYRAEGKVDNVKIKTLPMYQTGFDKGIGEWAVNGVWKIKNGAFAVSSNNSDALIDSSMIKNFAFRTDVTFADENSVAAILFRTDDLDRQGYRLIADAGNDKIQIVKPDGAQSTVLKETGWQLKTGKAYRFTVEMQGSVMKVYVGDHKEALLIVTDTTFEAGQLGIGNVTGGVSFDNILINTQFIDGPQMPPADASLLDQAAADAEKIDADDYTEDSYAKVKEALEALKEINRYDQKEIDAALSVLNDAVSGLVKKPADIVTLDRLVNEAKKLDESKYTAQSYAKLKAVLAKIQTLDRNDRKAVEAAIKELKEAIAGLVVKPPIQVTVPARNSVHQVGKLVYKVTKSAAKNGTVTVLRPKKKTNTTITIPNTVKLKGYTFKVTAISKNAFKNNKRLRKVTIKDNVSKIGTAAFMKCTKLTNVTIGKGLTTIGKKAFYNDKKLNRIVIKSTKVKNVYSKAFYKIKPKAVIDVPNKKAVKYRSVFKKGGQPKGVVIK